MNGICDAVRCKSQKVVTYVWGCESFEFCEFHHGRLCDMGSDGFKNARELTGAGQGRLKEWVK